MAKTPHEGDLNDGIRRVDVGGIPDETVVVTEGTSLTHEGVPYEAGAELTVPGPLAHQYAMHGYVTIKE